MNAEKKICQNCKKEFIIEPDDFGFYNKIDVPPPTFCHQCRLQRQLLFRNNRVFYRNKCALCGKEVLTVYNPNQSFVIYCRECWLSDNWDPVSYGRDYDFSITFFEQFRSLQASVPRSNLYQTNFISSEYCNYGLDFKESYLLFGGYNNERVYFGNQVFNSKDSLDIAFVEKAELSYEIFECKRTNRVFFSHHSDDCVDCRYLIDCNNCLNCFGCVGLKKKQYCAFNEQLTREEYADFIKSENLGSYSAHLKYLEKLSTLEMDLPHRYARIFKSASSDGDDLSEAKNTHFAFTSRQVEDSKFLFFIRNNVKNCYDNCFQGFNSEFLYEIAHGFGGSNSAFGVRNHYNQSAYYSEDCHDCQYVFGCEGLRKKKYCILNKQYSKEEYEKLVPKIISQMKDMPHKELKGTIYTFGEFFPPSLSPFAYNETIAQEYFPLSKDEALACNFKWEDLEKRNYQITAETNNLPDHIKDTSDDITSKVVGCAHKGKCKEQCTEAFKITSFELRFYKRMNLPLPRLCPSCRHFQRLKQRNPLKLWHRRCMCEKAEHGHSGPCKEEFETSYSPERPEVVYCEHCYQKEVY